LRQGLGLIAHLLERVGLKIARRLVVRVGEDDVVHDLGDPAIVALLVGLLRLVQNGIGAAHELDIVFAGLDRRQFVQGCRIAAEPAEIQDVGRFDVVIDRAVVAPVGPDSIEALGQLELLGNFDLGKAVIGEAQGLVVDEPIEVALAPDQLPDFGIAEGRPVMLREHDLGLVAPHRQHLIEVFDQGSGSRILAPRSE
jgi:hypothetical protein